MTKPAARYIVTFDDGQGACWPMQWDVDCAGAICAISMGPIALFPDRASARRAIRISSAYARLCQAQGEPANEDFLPPGRGCIKVVEAQESGQ